MTQVFLLELCSFEILTSIEHLLHVLENMSYCNSFDNRISPNMTCYFAFYLDFWFLYYLGILFIIHVLSGVYILYCSIDGNIMPYTFFYIENRAVVEIISLIGCWILDRLFQRFRDAGIFHM